MSKQKLNFAFIGCGGNARGHGRSVSSVEDVQIVALADPSEASLEAFKETVGLDASLPTYADHVEMLTAVKPDAVVISSPHGLHFQHIMDALDAGCHVHTEKPMVCTVDHAKQVIAKVEETGLHLMIGYQRHLSPTYQYCRQVVQSGELGRVNFVTAHQSQNWYRNQQGKWRQDPFLGGGGQLNDSGSHLIDILLWVLEASPDTVFAMIDNLDIEVDVLTAMSIKFDYGCLVQYQYCRACVWRRSGSFFRLVGGRRTLSPRGGNSIVKNRKGALNLWMYLKCRNRRTRMSLLLSLSAVSGQRIRSVLRTVCGSSN